MNFYLLYLLYILAVCVVPYVLYVGLSTYLHWQQRAEKGLTKHANDLSIAALLTSALFFLGNYTNTFTWITVVPMYPTLVLYGWVSEQPFAHHSFVTIRNWSWKMYLVVGCVTSVVLSFLGYHLYLAHAESILSFYFIRIALLPAFLGGSYLTRYVNNKLETGVANPSNIHFHHYQLFFFIALLPIFDDPVSQVAAGLALAPFIQGIASYGPDSIFT